MLDSWFSAIVVEGYGQSWVDLVAHVAQDYYDLQLYFIAL